ncbi:MAG: hypothetical protein HZB85_01420 [Deltaproteobacteria bacterium]|nr:hypothetical protein [Deltaproteobacteria bacterium]
MGILSRLKVVIVLAFAVSGLFVATGGAARAAEGAEWRFYHNSGDNSMLYYDMESVTAPSRGTADVWTKLEVRGKVYSLALYEISCVDRRLRTLIKYGYDNASKSIIPLPNSDETYPTRWMYIVPETSEAKLVKFICPLAKEKETAN